MLTRAVTAIRKGINKKSKSSSSNAANTSDEEEPIVSHSSRATSPSCNNCNASASNSVIEPGEYLR